LTELIKEKKSSMLFLILVLWLNPTSHLEDCYFCLGEMLILFGSAENKIQYQSISSAMKMMPYGEDLSIPVIQTN
jgi:hypothetical protein